MVVELLHLLVLELLHPLLLELLHPLVLELLHPAPDGHLDDLQAGAINFLDQAQDGGEHVGVLKVE